MASISPTDNSESFPYDKLPLELRIKIIEHVVENGFSDQPNNRIYFGSFLTEQLARKTFADFRDGRDVDDHSIKHLQGFHRRSDILALSMTSRMMRKEVMKTFYLMVTLVFQSIEDASLRLSMLGSETRSFIKSMEVALVDDHSPRTKSARAFPIWQFSIVLRKMSGLKVLGLGVSPQTAGYPRKSRYPNRDWQKGTGNLPNMLGFDALARTIYELKKECTLNHVKIRNTVWRNFQPRKGLEKIFDLDLIDATLDSNHGYFAVEHLLMLEKRFNSGERVHAPVHRSVRDMNRRVLPDRQAKTQGESSRRREIDDKSGIDGNPSFSREMVRHILNHAQLYEYPGFELYVNESSWE